MNDGERCLRGKKKGEATSGNLPRMRCAARHYDGVMLAGLSLAGVPRCSRIVVSA